MHLLCLTNFTTYKRGDYVNPGELDVRISVLDVAKIGDTYAWEQTASTWAKAEQLKSNNIFSQVGIGVKAVKFKIRERNTLTLHNAFRWQGKHCFLTDIVGVGRMYYEVTAALIEPHICTVERTGEPILNELNRPVYNESKTISFPGCLTEKYIGHTQGEPMAITEIRLVVVTPKVIELSVGEIVTINNTPYTVIIPHTLDEYKNEYEIMARSDVTSKEDI